MLTRRQHARAMLWGRIAYWIVMALPIAWSPLWLITHAGFYAYDDGYENYVRRCESP